jgi:hypothetical protein
LRKAVDGQDANMLAANARLHAAREILRGEDIVQIDGDRGSCEGVIDAGDGAMQVAQQRVQRETGIVCDAGEPLRVEQRVENILKGFDLCAEMLQSCLGGSSPGVVPAVVQPAFDTLFCGQRGKIGQGEKVLRFKMRAFLHELLSALVVDHARDRIGEAATLGITGGAGADGIALHHPSGAQPQRGVEARAECLHLGGAGGEHIRAAIGPACEEGTVLLEQDAVVDQGKRQQQVGQAVR